MLSEYLDLEDLVDVYNDGLRHVLDRHAPSATRRVRDRPSAPWMSGEIRAARRQRLQRRRAERRWRRTRLTEQREIFVKETAAVKSCVQAAKGQFYCNRFGSICSSRQLFSVSNEVSCKPHPSGVPRSELPQRFCDFCCSKIGNLSDVLDTRSCEPLTFSVYEGPMPYDPVTERNICELTVRSPIKGCMLGFIQTFPMKQWLNNLVPLITAIIIASLSTCTVPGLFKQAVVISLLKKPGLDTNDLKHFRQVSDLPCISKLIEKIVFRQLQKHLSDNNLLEMHVCLQKGS